MHNNFAVMNVLLSEITSCFEVIWYVMWASCFLNVTTWNVINATGKIFVGNLQFFNRFQSCETNEIDCVN